MNETFKLYKSIYFYIITLLKNQNISEELVMSSIDDLLKYQNKTDIKEFDYSALRIASSRLIVLTFLDLETIKSTSTLSLLGLASNDEKEFQKQIINILLADEQGLKTLRELFIGILNKFTKFINDSELITRPVLDKDLYNTLQEYLDPKGEYPTLKDLIEKRKHLKIAAKQKEDVNLKTITDFYSPITTAPFAFKMLDEYNDFLMPIVEEVIKYKHIYNLFEIVATYEITKWILVG